MAGARRGLARLPRALGGLAAALEGAAPCCSAAVMPGSAGLQWRSSGRPARPWGGAAAGGAQHAGAAPLPLLPAAPLQARGFLTDFTADTNKVYHERRLMGWSPEQMYEVVSRVEHYNQFVPWCVGSTVLKARADGGYIEAELEVGFQAFAERYTSKVTLTRPNRVHSSVADSRLFDHLESTWCLAPGPTPGTTWLTFKVDFAFRSALYRHVADLFFDQVVKRMMGAFEGRCAQLYGPSALGRGGRRAAAGRAAGGQPVAAAAAAQPAVACAGQQQRLDARAAARDLAHEQQQLEAERRLEEQQQQAAAGRGVSSGADRTQPQQRALKDAPAPHSRRSSG